MAEIASWLSRWVYPDRCALCGIAERPPICAACLAEFPPRMASRTWLPGGSDLAWRASLYEYTGRAAQAVKRLKFEDGTSLGPGMAADLAEAVRDLGRVDVDAVVPVPIHWTRRCQRGYNQAEILAADLPDVKAELLVRNRATRPQVGLAPEERRRNLRGAFTVEGDVVGLSVLLLDDVVTSGGTAFECARTLRAAGARQVALVTYARGG